MTQGFKARLRALVIAELGRCVRGLPNGGSEVFALPFLLIFTAVCPPGLVTAFVAMLLAAATFPPGAAPRGWRVSANEFLLTRAAYRREVFFAKVVPCLLIAPVVAFIDLVPTHRLPFGVAWWQTPNLPLAFPYFSLMFLVILFLCAACYRGIKPYGIGGVLVLGTVGVGAVLVGLIGSLLWRLVMIFPFAIVAQVVMVLFACLVLTMLMGISLSSFAHMEVGALEGKREQASVPAAETVGGRPGGLTPQATIARPIIPSESRPSRVSYLKPLLRRELSGRASSPWELILLPLVGIPAGQCVLQGWMTAPFAFYLLMIVPLQLKAGGSATEFLFTLAVPRRLPFRIKIASCLAFVAIAILIPVLFVLPVALSSSSEISVYLPRSAAMAARADVSEEDSENALFRRMKTIVNGFLLVPREAYGLYTVPQGRIARLLGFICLVFMVYLVDWLVCAPVIMRRRGGRPGETRVNGSSRLLILLMFFCLFWMGPVDAWVFVLAYTHPLYLIGATVAICLLLLRLAERQFVNLEVVS